MTDYASVQAAVAAHGLICRGGFHPRPADAVPGAAGTLVLVGNAGPEMWKAFSRGRRDEPHPLNAWARRVMGKVADGLGARALFPFDGPPYLPFQRWAQRAEPVHPSPIGPLIHPDFGLWHAYRAALVFAGKLALPPPDARPSPCETCSEKPCLSACPVDAFTTGAYDVPACTAHISAPSGADCVDRGCRARLACPVGRSYVYAPAQARHHMEGFLAAQGAAEPS